MSETGMNPTVRQRFVCEPCGLDASLWLCEHFSVASVAPDPRIAERQRFASEAVPARREQKEWEHMRGERDRLRTEVSRLEALILQINDDLGRTWDTGLVDAEALRIRSKA